MPLDPNIIMGGQQPQAINPMQTVGQLMQMKDLSGQIALRNAQVQTQQAQMADIQAQAQQRQRDMADQDFFQKSMANPDTYAKTLKGDFSWAAGQVQPKSIQAAATNAAALNEKINQADISKAALYGSSMKTIGSALSGLGELRKPDGSLDLDAINAQLASTKANLSKAGAFKNANMDESELPDRFNSEAEFKAALAHTNVLGEYVSQQVARREAEAKASGAEATTRETTAKASQAEQVTAGMKNGLTPAEQEQARQAAATLAETAKRDTEAARHQRAEEGISAFSAQSTAALARANQMLQSNNQADREIGELTKSHATNLTATQKVAQSLNEADKLLSSGNGSDLALGVQKAAIGLAGGAGSGARFTDNEFNRILKAHGVQDSLSVIKNKLTNGVAISDSQKQGLQDAVRESLDLSMKQMRAENDTITSIQNSPDRASRIYSEQRGRAKINFLANGGMPKNAEVRTNPNTGHQIYSTDNGATVYDVETGERLK